MVSSSGRRLCTGALYFMHYDIFVMGALFIAHARQIYIFFQGSGYKNKLKDSPLNACRQESHINFIQCMISELKFAVGNQSYISHMCTQGLKVIIFYYL